MKIELVYAGVCSDGGVLVKIRISSGDNSELQVLRLSLFDWRAMKLKSGAELTTEEFEALQKAAEYSAAYRKGVELLSYGANSRAALERKLVRRGFAAPVSARAATALLDEGLINENADAEATVRSCLEKGYGKGRIIIKLRERGYGAEVVNAALERLDDFAFSDQCAELIIKKYRQLPVTRGELEKIIAAMTRYGYSYGEVRDAIEQLKNT